MRYRVLAVLCAAALAGALAGCEVRYERRVETKPAASPATRPEGKPRGPSEPAKPCPCPDGCCPRDKCPRDKCPRDKCPDGKYPCPRGQTSAAECVCPRPCDHCACEGSPRQGGQCLPGMCPRCPLAQSPRRPSSWRASGGAAAEDPPCNFPGPDVGKISLGGQVGPDGKTEVAIDLPVDVRIRNIGSKVGRHYGMCVTTSAVHGAKWHNMRDWYGFRDWAAQFEGGSDPQKMDQQIKQYAAEKHLEVPPYLQYEGNDPAVIVAALQAGLCPSNTYDGRDGVRYDRHIDHFVNCVYLDRATNLAAVMDNNGKPEDLIWMSYDEFVERWTSRGRGGWVFLWLVAPPPPPCCN
jgi:hypothetical protein